MWSFLKKIFSERDSDVTVVVLDENNPDGSSSFKIRAAEVIKITLLVMVVSVFITAIIFFATPIGLLYQHHQDEQIRQQVLDISDRVVALQDTLAARDAQIDELKYFFRTARDTTFEIDGDLVAGSEQNISGRGFRSSYAPVQPLSRAGITVSGRLDRAPDFPSDLPVDGRLTQTFSAEQGHYGIDIAARSNSNFRTVADGTVVNTNWTITHGYVIFVQHSGGMMSVYKHGSRLHKKQGDFVLKGDILGEIGDRGVLSSGSHLHLEIWKDGTPQDPLMYINP